MAQNIRSEVERIKTALASPRSCPGCSGTADDLAEDAVTAADQRVDVLVPVAAGASEEEIEAAVAAACPRPPCAVCGRPTALVLLERVIPAGAAAEPRPAPAPGGVRRGVGKPAATDCGGRSRRPKAGAADGPKAKARRKTEAFVPGPPAEPCP